MNIPNKACDELVKTNIQHPFTWRSGEITIKQILNEGMGPHVNNIVQQMFPNLYDGSIW